MDQRLHQKLHHIFYAAVVSEIAYSLRANKRRTIEDIQRQTGAIIVVDKRAHKEHCMVQIRGTEYRSIYKALYQVYVITIASAKESWYPGWSRVRLFSDISEREVKWFDKWVEEEATGGNST